MSKVISYNQLPDGVEMYKTLSTKLGSSDKKWVEMVDTYYKHGHNNNINPIEMQEGYAELIKNRKNSNKSSKNKSLVRCKQNLKMSKIQNRLIDKLNAKHGFNS
jgi:Zn/Cd-binding protein ZinT